MPVTLRQIARELNLSVSLVSQALSDRPSRVSDLTRHRIRQAASRLGYRPIASARALRSGKSGMVALAFLRPSHSYPHGGEIPEVLAECLGKRGYGLIIHAVPDRESMMRRLEDLVANRSCEAVVLSGLEPEVEEQGALLERLCMPFVVKGHHEDLHPGWLQVDFDHKAMTEQIVHRFAAMGHRRIAYIGFETEQAYVTRLLDGYRNAMQELLGAPVRDGFASSLADNGIAAGERVRQWMSLPADERPTAIALLASADMWCQAELALQGFGLRMGDSAREISVAGEGSGQQLLFGNAHGYDISMGALAAVIEERMLEPLMRGDYPGQSIVRIMPVLRPIGSMHLLDRMTAPNASN